jgi:uncharacterized RmlC-like cupin family protein
MLNHETNYKTPNMKESSTAAATKPTCRLIRPYEEYEGKQDLTYVSGISAESVGAKALCMHLLTIPPGGRAKAHMHENHETAIYIIRGESSMFYGEKLEQQMHARAGDLIYIPAGVPHLPYNDSNEPCLAVIARTDPNEQESVVLLPELESEVL